MKLFGCDDLVKECVAAARERGLSDTEVAFELRKEAQIIDPQILHGAKPGRSGGYLEARVAASFGQFGVRCVKDHDSFHHDSIFNRKDKILIEQCVQRGIKLDFLYVDFKRNLRLPIECKHQSRSGSVDRKLYYSIDDLVSLETKQYWLLVHGDGFSPKVMQRVQNKIMDLNRAKKIRGRLVFDALLFKAIQNLVEHGNPL